MLTDYLNQTAEYRPCAGTDDRGQPIYGAPVILPCRRQEMAQNLLTATGQSVCTQHVYYLAQEVSEGDMLDGLVIAGVSVMTGLGGEAVGYKAVM